MTLINLLQIALIIVTLVIIIDRNNLRIVIFFSAFSLISASLYYFYKSPDLALAEVAIGSAITPLIFIIAISKQREFLVISHIKDKDNFLSTEHGRGYRILDKFTKDYGLKLVINSSDNNEIYGIFRTRNVDLVIEKDRKTGNYILKGKRSSILMNRLNQITKDDKRIKVVMIEEGEAYD